MSTEQYAFVVDGAITQVVSPGDIFSANGVLYFGANPAGIQGFALVVDPGYPDTSQVIVTGDTVQMVNGVPTRVYTTEPLPAAGQAPAAPALTLAQAQAKQVAALRTACSNSFLTFTSSALGSPAVYPGDWSSQRNLNQAAVASGGGKLWCQPAGGDWQFVQHTQAQAQQVLADFIAVREPAQEQFSTLSAQVNAITDTSAAGIAAVQAIVWPAATA